MKNLLTTLCITALVLASSVAIAVQCEAMLKPMIGTSSYVINKNMDWDKSTAGTTHMTDLASR